MTQKPYFQQNDGHLDYRPPRYLSKQAGEIWRKVVPFLESSKKVQRIDSTLVEMFCTQYDIYRSSYENIKQNGIQIALTKIVQNSKGEVLGEEIARFQKNPALMTLKDATTQMLAIGSELGLSPKARQELMDITNEDEDDSPSMQELLEGGGEDEF